MASRAPHDAAGMPLRLDGMPGPRWNRSRGIYPTALRRYLECPRRCRLEYIDKIPCERPWDLAMEVGNALHKVMERIGNILRNGKAPPPTASYLRWIERLLPADRYDDPRARAVDIDDVMEWAAVCETYINDGRTEVLIVEHYTPRRWDDPGSLGSVLLGAKADVVVRRHDQQGPYIEIIDYKTGHNRDHTQFTPLLSCIALKKRIQAVLPDQRTPRIAFSYLWLRDGDIDTRWQTRGEMGDRWRELHDVLLRMVSEERWPMQPNARLPLLSLLRHPLHADVARQLTGACHVGTIRAGTGHRGGMHIALT